MNKISEEMFDGFWDEFLPWAKERDYNLRELVGDVNRMVAEFPAFVMWKHEQQRVHPGTN